MVFMGGRLETPAQILNTNRVIAADDFTFDGGDLVVNGCTVTIQGGHHLNSLQITNGGVFWRRWEARRETARAGAGNGRRAAISWAAMRAAGWSLTSSSAS